MNKFKSDYAVPPGEIIKQNLLEMGMSRQEFIHKTGFSEKTISRILNGTGAITSRTAPVISEIIGGSTKFWLNLEYQYQQDTISYGKTKLYKFNK